jgi:hypothetical protein
MTFYDLLGTESHAEHNNVIIKSLQIIPRNPPLCSIMLSIFAYIN